MVDIKSGADASNLASGVIQEVEPAAGGNVLVTGIEGGMLYAPFLAWSQGKRGTTPSTPMYEYFYHESYSRWSFHGLNLGQKNYHKNSRAIYFRDYHRGFKQLPNVLRYRQPYRVGLYRTNLTSGLLSKLQTEEDLEALWHRHCP